MLVIGESIIDEYNYCEMLGKSGKEPILAVKELATERFAGGAGRGESSRRVHGARRAREHAR